MSPLAQALVVSVGGNAAFFAYLLLERAGHRRRTNALKRQLLTPGLRIQLKIDGRELRRGLKRRGGGDLGLS
jgi:hypothetical protein